VTILASTKVTFPGGSLEGSSKILFCKPLISSPNQIAVVTEKTPFHPLDHHWPDQPGDKGWVTIQNIRYPLVACLTAAFNQQTGEFIIDQEIKSRKIKRDDPSWFFLVAHVIEGEASMVNNCIGQTATLEVEGAFREKISRAHTACHLAALALNKVTQKFWKKEPEKLDALGNPNLDAEAIVVSKIDEECSTDHYRCGKSLRKKGFDDVAFFAAFKEIENDINQQLLAWSAHPKGIKISLVPQEAYLNEKREWHCELDGKKAIIPCGGTHILAVSSPMKVMVRMSQEAEGEFTMISKIIQKI
jgi:alanyl-tRNA synthetase